MHPSKFESTRPVLTRAQRPSAENLPLVRWPLSKLVVRAAMIAVVFCGHGASAGAASGGIQLTRNADIGAKFGAPGPRTCSTMKQPSKGPISPNQARAHIICGFEQDYQGGTEELNLIGQIQVQVSKGRPYDHVRDSLEGIDPHQLVYDIRGTSVTYSCVLPGGTLSGAQLCSRTVNAHDEGRCHQTTFSEWRCTWGDLSAPMSTDTWLRVPVPKASEVE